MYALLTLMLVSAATETEPTATERSAEESPAPVDTDDPGSSPDPASRAAQLFRAGSYAEAAAAFEEAYQTTDDPAFLFARGQALRRGGNCVAAIEMFEAFIATSPPEPDVQEAQHVIDECHEILGQGAVSPSAPPPIPRTEATPVPMVPAPEMERDPWHRDAAGGVLLGFGVGAVVVGSALYGSAFALARDRNETEAEYERRDRTVRGLAVSGPTIIAVGGALIVASIVRYAIVRRTKGRRDTSLTRPLHWHF